MVFAAQLSSFALRHSEKHCIVTSLECKRTSTVSTFTIPSVMWLHVRAVLFACAIARLSLAQDSWGSDVTHNGNYLIARCSKDVSGGKADQLISLLQETGRDLPKIIFEANTGTDSPHGFKSLFTSNESIPAVTANFAKLSNSTTVIVDGQQQQVTFVCLEPGDPFTAPMYDFVVSDRTGGIAFSQFGSPNIYLSPSFFRDISRDPAPYHCPLFRGDAIARNSDDIFSTTQYGTIIHELMDKYLHFETLDQPETYYLRDCIRLSEAQQLQNAENYNFFASCESPHRASITGWLISTPAIKAGCSGYPK